MISRPLSAPAATHRSRAGFSLVEVTLAIGILAFCLIPLLGMLPTGLNAQRRAADRALATDALTMLSTAVHNALVTRDSNGTPKYSLPLYLSDTGGPLTYTAGGSASSYTYAILDDGSIRQTADKTPARQTMVVKIYPPATDANLSAATSGTAPVPSSAVRVYAIIAWPALSSDTNSTTPDELKNRQGFIEGFITYVPPS